MATGSLSAVAPAGIVTALCPPKVTGLTIPAASAAPRMRGPTVILPNDTGAAPKVLSRRIRTLSPAIVTRAIIRTVVLLILVSPSPCCDVAHAVTQPWVLLWASTGGVSSAKAAAIATNISVDFLVTVPSQVRRSEIVPEAALQQVYRSSRQIVNA